MKIMVRSIMKVLPGKLEEATEIEKRHMAIANRVLGISSRIYHRLSGGGDTARTIIIEAEFDSLAAFEELPMKMGADPEMKKLVPKLGAVVDTVEFEFYIPIQQ
jgi:hypothetical protein